MMTSLGVIGCGNMGSAILKGLADVQDLVLNGMDMDRERLAALAGEIGVKPCQTPRELVEKSDYIILAVKPHQIPELLKQLAPRLRPGQTLVSIAAGVSLEKLKICCSGVCPMVRVMPNTPAMVNAGVFAVCLDDPALSDKQKDFVASVFERLGKTFVLEEKYFDAFTAVAGSGPAYVFYFMEALVEAGVALGFTREQSTIMVKELLLGSAKLAMSSDQHLSILREMVTSPAGTTIAALSHLDAKAVRGSIMQAVAAACERSRELG